MTESHDPIKIVGIDTPNVGAPRDDGTRGCALYRVPVKLSRRPSAAWAGAFSGVWDRPPQWSSRHRPGIAHVSGDCIVLDGTTIEEVRDYHAKTLSLVVAKLNDYEAQSRAEDAARHEREGRQRAEHAENLTRVSEDIRFE